ncbi:MAG: sigma 54-interacting response regulator [Chitinophagaceae bacterium]
MNKKVLIVEDEFIVANNLRQVLQRFGYEVSGIAASASEAEENLQENKPDIVLLDIRLQGERTGIDVAKKLNEEGIAFIYLSANSSQKVLEEAKTTDPYGFLVKPFRKKDLRVMLDIAWYRYIHSLETKNNRENILQKQLRKIGGHWDIRQMFLEITRVIQSYIPFDLITTGQRPFKNGQFNDNGYLRIGFDEYQFIGEDELLAITNMKKTALAVILENTITKENSFIYHTDTVQERMDVPSLQKTLTETFKLQSFLVFPVVLNNGQSFHYTFYSRQRDTYTNSHIMLLNSLTAQLVELASKMAHGNNQDFSTENLTGSYKKPIGEGSNHPEFKNIIGNHHTLLAALDLTAQVAPYNTSVLILGESGTGKEKLAQSIHLLSPRKNGPYAKVSCAAIPATLIESELFGHEKGAFTGATEKRKGRIEQADGGTIFLDEIGELLPEMQVKILRFLQEKEIQSLGGNSVIKVNVRIIAATNRNLEKEVAEGNFRLDLYYRLNVFPVTLPPLRERRSDIEALAIFFGKKYCGECNKPFIGISGDMLEAMMAYEWPGNIRELENVLEQSVVLNDGKSKLELKRVLPRQSKEMTTKPPVNTLEDVRNIQRETEREYIISILKKANGRVRGVNGAAEMLNMKPSTLESKMSRLNIKREHFINIGD